MMKNTVRALGALLLLPATVVFAGTGKETKKIETVKEESWITGDLGVTVVTKYLSRGLTLENQGLITQPFADLYFKLYEGEGALNKVSLNLGIWSSIHSEKTDAGAASGGGGSTTRAWYEFDYTVGLAMTFAKNWTFTPSFFAFLSPNDGFSTFYGANLFLGYNDSELWGNSGFALNPSVTVLFELENKAGSGADEGIYYEVALNPTKAFGPLSVSLPIKAGFGSNDFYGSLGSGGAIDNEPFGYVSGGILFSYGLSSIPAKFGVWTVSAGATFLYHGEGTEDFNTRERGGNVSNGDNHDWIFNAGMSVAF